MRLPMMQQPHQQLQMRRDLDGEGPLLQKDHNERQVLGNLVLTLPLPPPRAVLPRMLLQPCQAPGLQKTRAK